MFNFNNEQQIKYLQQITLIIIIIIILINYDYLYLIIEYLLFFIKKIFKIQLIHLDSTDNWKLPNLKNYSDYMMNDLSWSQLIPTNSKVSWYKVYPSDLSTLKLNYLSPLWMEYVTSHFDLFNYKNDLLLENINQNGLNTNKIPGNRYVVSHRSLSKIWGILRETNGNFTDWSLLIDSYINSSLSEWELLNTHSKRVLNLYDFWPNDGIRLPFLNNRLLYLELLHSPNKVILTDFTLTDDLPLHSRFTNTGSEYIKEVIYNNKYNNNNNNQINNFFDFQINSKSHIERIKDAIDYCHSKTNVIKRKVTLLRYLRLNEESKMELWKKY